MQSFKAGLGVLALELGVPIVPARIEGTHESMPKGSRMPRDLRNSQVVILSSVWNDWSEPNDSRKFGSNASNRILHRDFCQVRTYGERPDDGKPLYELWLRKDSGRCPTT